MYRLLSLIVLLALIPDPGRAQEPVRSTGARLLEPFKRDLQQALLDGLASGPEEAVAACRIAAPEIARSLSSAGVRVGRASQRLRNRANAAPPWVEPVLEAYARDSALREARTVALEDGRSGYVEPIIVQPLCLACHGTDLAPAVAERIAALYPNDRAIGYAVGDLRGVFWVEFPGNE